MSTATKEQQNAGNNEEFSRECVYKRLAEKMKRTSAILRSIPKCKGDLLNCSDRFKNNTK